VAFWITVLVSFMVVSAPVYVLVRSYRSIKSNLLLAGIGFIILGVFVGAYNQLPFPLFTAAFTVGLVLIGWETIKRQVINPVQEYAAQLQKEADRQAALAANLEIQVDERIALLHEIRNRIKKNYSILLKLVEKTQAQQQPLDGGQAYRRSRERIQALATIHESLSYGGQRAVLDIGVYLNMLLQHIQSEFPNEVDTVIEIDQIFLEQDQAVPCGMILAELVRNAFMHAFRTVDRGNLRLSGKLGEDHMCRILVQDDGQGFTSEQPNENPKNFGYRLVALLVDQLNGQIEIKSQQGTGILIEFPLAG
jgi:two-component sensor histidine kinase